METSYLGNGGRTMGPKHPSSRRYPPEVKERAVQLVLTTIDQNGERHGVIARIARQLDVGAQTLSQWVRQAEVDRGTRPGTTSAVGRASRSVATASGASCMRPACMALAGEGPSSPPGRTPRRLGHRTWSIATSRRR